MANVCWWFFFSKVIELSDTVSLTNLTDMISADIFTQGRHAVLKKKCFLCQFPHLDLFHPKKKE